MFQPGLTLARTLLLTNIYTNSKKKSLKSRVLSNIDISDHYSIFAIIPIKNKSKKLENSKIRNMKNFDKEEFLITLENKLNNLFVNNTLSVNELFDKFLALFADVVNDFAPIRKATRKEKKLKQKPWITKNLLKCILTKNKMYNDLPVNRNSLDKVESYKRYRNVLNCSLRIAKSAYYHRVGYYVKTKMIQKSLEGN